MSHSTERPRRHILRAPPRQTRSKPVVSYVESSDDSDGDELYDGELATSHVARHAITRARASSIARQTPAKRKRPASSHRTYKRDTHDLRRASKRQRHLKSSSSKPKASQLLDYIPSSGVIPAWQALPYQILVQIFRYASYPLYDEHTFQPLPSSRWLLSMARLCRDFAEPAFTVLYASPPLVPMILAHRLVDLLKADPTHLAFKYRQKVESLRIDVGQVAAYSLPGSGHLDLHGLIKDLPRLADLEFYHQMDMSPYRNLDESIKWTYPESIFEALEYVDPAADALRGDKTRVCKLRSWRWSSRLAGKKLPINKIPEIHLKPYFSSLQKVAFVNYQIPALKKDEEDPKHENLLAQALQALPELKHLIFESSTLVNSRLLPLLPTGLQNLELINCWEVVADHLADFLLTHGRQLRCLTLNHNQSLSLGFLPVLGTACPRLEVFRMNLTYYNLHSTYRDSEPIYEHLLLPDQIPVWSSTLQTIELIQLRKWDTEAAEMFFDSLLESAGTLPDLRRLVIQAILNIGWRDRASFRDKWVGSLNRVFKRISEPPKVITSILPFPAHDAVTESPKIAEHKPSDIVAPVPRGSSLRSSMGSKASATSSSSPTNASASGTGTPSSARRSARTATQNLQSGKYAESESSDSDTPLIKSKSRAEKRRAALKGELEILKQTAGKDSSALSTDSHSLSSEESEEMDDESGPDDGKGKWKEQRKGKGKGKEKEVIQGMCDIVEVRIDNLRPTENQVTERDFLDEEKSGDEEWTEGNEGYDEGYAW